MFPMNPDWVQRQKILEHRRAAIGIYNACVRWFMRSYPVATKENAHVRAEYILNLNLGALRAQLYDLFVKATDVEGTAARQRARDQGFHIDDATVQGWIAVRSSKNAEQDMLEFVDASLSTLPL
jgi:hypothetical protein